MLEGATQGRRADQALWQTHPRQPGSFASSFLAPHASLTRTQASSDRKQLDIGANLFIGNLDPAVDETTLWNAFSNFGQLVQTAKVRSLRPLVVRISVVTARTDRSRSGDGRLKRLRFRCLRLVRVLRCRHRRDGQRLPHE
jgi:hypothetical protein